MCLLLRAWARLVGRVVQGKGVLTGFARFWCYGLQPAMPLHSLIDNHLKREPTNLAARWSVLICLLTLLSVSAVAQSQAADRTYQTYCVSCHAANGSGATKAGDKMKLSDLRSEQVQKQSDDDLFRSIAHGVRHRQYPHAFLHRGLTEAQVAKLVAYIRMLPKSK
jgi:cytochrome c6